MDIETITQLATIGQAITTTGVLLVWVMRAESRRSLLSEKILEDWERLREYVIERARSGDKS